jgi:hypothetical protein
MVNGHAAEPERRRPHPASKAAAPVGETAAEIARQRSDLQAGLLFVKNVLPLLGPSALERARSVRLRAHDPARALLL